MNNFKALGMIVFSLFLNACGNLDAPSKDAIDKQIELNSTSGAAPVVYESASVSLVNPIPAYSNKRNYSIQFTSPVSVASFECKLDYAEFTSCASPYQLPTVNEGDHMLQVRAVTTQGIRSAPTTLLWREDLTPGIINFTAGPEGGINYSYYGNMTLKFDFTTLEFGGSPKKSITCQLDAGPIVACPTGTVSYTMTTDAIQHTLTIRLTDSAGNVTVATRKFSFSFVDPNPPGGFTPT